MKKFLIKNFSQDSVKNELLSIGFDKSYLDIAQNKYKSNIYKIYNLSPHQATILKQTALSCGTDCAIHRDVLLQKIPLSDVILFATNSQITEIIKKLSSQPFSLNILAQDLEMHIQNKNLKEININKTKFDWHKTYLMGILNITPNSFSDGDEYFNEDKALNHFSDMIELGADIIDIGAESTAPNNEPISPTEELQRLNNVLIKCKNLNQDIPISIDTRNASTAKKALELGANIINDISGLMHDDNMATVIANNNAYIVLTYNDLHENNNILDETIKGLTNRIQKATLAGINTNKIILDPGLGFNKTFEENIELIKHANEICSLGFPVLYGLSRKSFVQKLTNLKPKETEFVNVSLALYLSTKGVNILRVHDIQAHKIAFCAIDKVLYD